MSTSILEILQMMYTHPEAFDFFVWMLIEIYAVIRLFIILED